MFIGDGERHGNLASRLFTKLTAILMRDADGMLTLFGNARIVGDPRANWSMLGYCRKHVFTHRPQYGFIAPIRISDKMEQCLMGSTYAMFVGS